MDLVFLSSIRLIIKYGLILLVFFLKSYAGLTSFISDTAISKLRAYGGRETCVNCETA